MGLQCAVYLHNWIGRKIVGRHAQTKQRMLWDNHMSPATKVRERHMFRDGTDVVQRYWTVLRWKDATDIC